MKKILACFLSTLMMLTMAISISAAENCVDYDFEGDEVGDFYNVDNQISPVPKNGKIEVVKMDDGNTVLKIHHIANETKYDCYVDIAYGGNELFGVSTSFVCEYDLYIESVSEDTRWQVLTSREEPDGAIFQYFTNIEGKDLGLYLIGADTPVATLKLKTWHHIAVSCDQKSDTYSVYLNGVCLGANLEYDKNGNADAFTTLRTAFRSSQGDAIAYLDNVIVYNGTEPRTQASTTPADTTAAPADTTAAPADTTAAPADTTAAPVTVDKPTPEIPAAPTADVAFVVAAVAAIAASGVILFKKKH